MSLVPTKTFAAGAYVDTLVVWHDTLVSGCYKNIKQWNHEGVCVKTLEAESQGSVYTLVVWNNFLYSGSRKEIKQWTPEGVCVNTFNAGSTVWSLAVWNDLLYSGSDDNTIKQWVDEEAERPKQTELFAALDICDAVLQEKQNAMNTIKQQATTKIPATLIDEVQGMDLQPLLTQIENVQTNHLKFPQHQQEVNTKKELGP